VGVIHKVAPLQGKDKPKISEGQGLEHPDEFQIVWDADERGCTRINFELTRGKYVAAQSQLDH